MRSLGIHRLGISSALLLCSGALGAVSRHEREMFGISRARAESGGAQRMAAPHWAVDPAEPGPDRPPSGRSLFDAVVSRDRGTDFEIPFPIQALVARIERSAGCSSANGGCTRKVLIPLGRSLQRTAAQAEGLFASPRLVVAVDREPGPGRGAPLRLRDRLFLGYQPASGVIEVISYNEAAGRFEFQIVRDYRNGTTPRLVYANRAVCTACHQNQAPLFSRPQWDETHANPRIARRLAALQGAFYGVPARGAISEPEAIDDATDRANRLAVTQRLWWEGCGERREGALRCRAAAVLAAVQYRLSDERGFAFPEFEAAVAATLARNARQLWPGGLALPNSDIPDREPLNASGDAQDAITADVSAGLEALAPRAPAEVWSPHDPLLARHLVLGLADALGRNEVDAVERGLARRRASSAAPEQAFTANCELDARRRELRFACRSAAAQGGVELQGQVATQAETISEQGELEKLALSADEPGGHFELRSVRSSHEGDELVVSFVPQSHGRAARLRDGRAITRIELRARGAAGSARLIVIDDLAPLREAVSALERRSSGDRSDLLLSPTFDSKRVVGAVVAQLGEEVAVSRGRAPAAMPEAIVDSERARAVLPPAAKPFESACGACHGGPDPTPPNFLYGDSARVQAALESCAPRIFERLRMWDLTPELRAKTPMPPAHAVLDGAARVHEGMPRNVAPLQAAAGRLLESTRGRADARGELFARGYEALRPCLPAGR